MMEEQSRTTRQSDTYVVPHSQKEQELKRLIGQDEMLTRSMGGILPEQDDPARFTHVLDIACGPGTWLLEMARMYPHMLLSGIDINRHFIEHARAQAQVQQVADRTTFQVMDATLMLEFPDDYFDLVNMRLGSSFLRTWDWPKVLNEMSRVTKAGGTIRVVESEISGYTNSPALSSFKTLLTGAFHQSGHLFEPVGRSIVDNLPSLLHQHTSSDHAQNKLIGIEHQAGTPGFAYFYEDVQHLFHTIRPFLHKWGYDTNLDEITQQALIEMRETHFVVGWDMIIVWAIKRPDIQKRKAYQ